MLFEDYAPAIRELLGDERIAWLRRLPAEHREDDLVLLHASPGDLWRAPPPDAEDSLLVATYESCEQRKRGLAFRRGPARVLPARGWG